MALFAPRNTWLIGILVLAAACSAPPPADGDPSPTTTMILVRDHALKPSIARDGQRVALIAFEDASFADLVSGAIDTVRLADVDAASGCVDRPSLDETGATILFNYNQGCYQSSFATSVMYLKPVVGGVAERMSVVARSGIGLLSADAAVVAFLSEDLGASDGDTNGSLDVYVRTVSSTVLQRASLAHDGVEADADVFLSDISDDGRYVLMMSWATNLVPNDTNGFADVFLHDRTGGSIERVSLAPDGGELNGASFNARISGDGRYVVFETRARNVAPGLTQNDNRLFVREVATGAMARLDVPAGGDPELGIRQGEFDVSANGRFVVFVSGNSLLPGAEEESLAVYRVENPLWTP